MIILWFPLLLHYEFWVRVDGIYFKFLDFWTKKLESSWFVLGKKKHRNFLWETPNERFKKKCSAKIFFMVSSSFFRIELQKFYLKRFSSCFLFAKKRKKKLMTNPIKFFFSLFNHLKKDYKVKNKFSHDSNKKVFLLTL